MVSLSWSWYCNINNPSPRPLLPWNCYTTAPTKNSFPLGLFASFTFSSFHSVNYSRLISMSKPCYHRADFSSPPFLASSSSSMTEASSTLNPNPDATLLLRDICSGKVPEHILKRAEEMGFIVPTDVQKQSLPIMLSGRDCILHAQTGSGKTLAYLLTVFSVNFRKTAVQALIVVPNRELGMQVTKVARMLSARLEESKSTHQICTVMALLDGGTLKRHKSWLKAEPPQVVIATIASLTYMLDKHAIKLENLRVLVIDEAILDPE